ncbi:MAG: heme exporter protein CcmB [Granulosicoccaceae bacterium]
MTQISLGIAFWRLLRRDLLLALRRGNEWLNPLVFFVIVVSLFPLGIGPGEKTLELIGPGVVWVSALLATLLALDGLFQADHQDGALELILLSPHPLSVLVLAKVLAHWLITGLPLVLLSPLLGVLMHQDTQVMGVLMASLAMGTATLSLIGAIGAALTVGVKRGGVLLSLLVLPLYVPVLIFGSNAVASAGMGLAVEGQLSVLGGALFLALALAPLATAAALRVSVE